jgi:hypothetical protein
VELPNLETSAYALGRGRGELRYRQPVINGVLYPIWHWDRTDVPAFSYQVNDCPMIFAALDVVKR